jgi:hypothetical protein
LVITVILELFVGVCASSTVCFLYLLSIGKLRPDLEEDFDAGNPSCDGRQAHWALGADLDLGGVIDGATGRSNIGDTRTGEKEDAAPEKAVATSREAGTVA